MVKRLQEHPVRPVRLDISDGTVYEVRHPELVKVERTRAHVFFPASDAPHSVVPKRDHALIHITGVMEIEESIPANRPSTNGH